MNLTNPSAFLAEALVRAGQHTQTQRKATGETGLPVAAPPAFTIALSREVGARGTSVAREISARLGWPVYDHELLEGIARDLEVSVHLVESLDERAGSWLQDTAAAFPAAPAVTETVYFRRLLKMLLSLGARGECVIVGRGAAQFLSPLSTLRVRLLAALPDRIAVMSRELRVSLDEAARYVATTDRERIRFIKDHFQKDPTDPQHYDLVLNTSRFSVRECADFVIEALHRLQARAVSKEPVAPVP